MKTAGIAAVAMIVVGSIGLSAATPRKADPLNDKCPLKGEAIDKGKTSEVKVAFCCANCKGKFDRDPVASLGKVDKLPNEKCPLSGKALGDATSTVTIAFCCGDCKEKFDNEPARYLGKVKAK
jgi:YHS domain-containing protein